MRIAATAAIAALLAGAVPATAATAAAADGSDGKSSVGGELLGKPGTHVHPRTGVQLTVGGEVLDRAGARTGPRRAVPLESGKVRLGHPGEPVRPGQGAPRLPDDLTAASWLVADAKTGEILATRNAHRRLAPASTLKMLFAAALLPKLGSSQRHRVTATELEGLGDGSSAVGVEEGMTYAARDLWHGVFLASGNDAVHVLMSMNGGKAKTVTDMQATADDLGAADTVVKEPDGYDAAGQSSSAYDLTLIARAGLRNPEFREYAGTASATFPAAGGAFEVGNTNRLLTGDFDIEPYKGMAGVKNGNTTEAGATFTGLAKRGDRELLVTVMRPSDDHNQVYREAASLLDWGFAAAGTVEPVGHLVEPKSSREDAKPARHAHLPTAPPAGTASNDSAGTTAALTTAAVLLALLSPLAFPRVRTRLRRRRS
ncbi:D-alanyl-D-alanine carboxypeptidase family protein [Streptomyces boninensis]|uniref:D-alanyl-D-alanine carboxypeptidase family protein n=1 Tax=Streptomyces boninensis TaxID=2039455 RepID=UPI003B21E54E